MSRYSNAEPHVLADFEIGDKVLVVRTMEAGLSPRQLNGCYAELGKEYYILYIGSRSIKLSETKGGSSLHNGMIRPVNLFLVDVRVTINFKKEGVVYGKDNY